MGKKYILAEYRRRRDETDQQLEKAFGSIYEDHERFIRSKLLDRESVDEIVVDAMLKTTLIERIKNPHIEVFFNIQLQGGLLVRVIPALLGKKYLKSQALQEYWDQLIEWDLDPCIYHDYSTRTWCLGVRYPAFFYDM
jgi:hypothetical protein